MIDPNNFPMGIRFKDASLSKIDFNPEYTEKIAAWMRNPKHFLVIIGNPGLGKTYLCAAAYNSFKDRKKVFYLTGSQFFREVRSAINEGIEDVSYKLERMANYDGIWIIDDLGSEITELTDFQKKEITDFVNMLYQNQKPFLFTTNVWSKNLGQKVSPAFKSRIMSSQNVVIEMDIEDKRQLGL